MLRMLCYAVAATASAFSSSVLAKDAGDFKGLSIDVAHQPACFIQFESPNTFPRLTSQEEERVS